MNNVGNEMIENFFKFIYERQRIYYRKEALKLPREEWTEDLVLKIYKFTNVFRELDTGTKFLRTFIEPHCKDFETYFLNLFLYRMFNLVSSWKECVPEGAIQFAHWNKDQLTERYNALKESGKPIFTNCHMIPPLHQFNGRTKAESLMIVADRYVVENIEELKRIVCKSNGLEQITRDLQAALPGVGPFLGYEISTDLTHEKIGFRDDWDTIKEEWTNPGPGARRGMRWIYPDMSKKEIENVLNFNTRAKELRDMQPEVFKNLDLPFLDISYKNSYLGLRDIEHSLCEFDKYWRTVQGTSRPKNYYKPSV